MDYQDKELTCKDCQAPFTFTAGEQKFFAEKRLSTPVRCKPCREYRREERQQGKHRRERDLTMKTFLWWIGLPLRIACGAIILVIMCPIMPRRADDVWRDAWQLVKGDGG